MSGHVSDLMELGALRKRVAELEAAQTELLDALFGATWHGCSIADCASNEMPDFVFETNHFSSLTVAVRVLEKFGRVEILAGRDSDNPTWRVKEAKHADAKRNSVRRNRKVDRI